MTFLGFFFNLRMNLKNSGIYDFKFSWVLDFKRESVLGIGPLMTTDHLKSIAHEGTVVLFGR